MKKQFIAKLLVLVMILAMVPATALAVAAGNNDGSNNQGSNNQGSGGGTVIRDTQVVKVLPGTSGITVSKTATSADKVAVADGKATIKATVVNGTANVTMTEMAVKKLANAVQDGVITLVIDDEGASKLNVSLPAKALTNLAKATGADLTIQSSVATISVSNALISANAGTTGTVKITAAAGESGATASVLVNGKELKDVEGIKVG